MNRSISVALLFAPTLLLPYSSQPRPALSAGAVMKDKAAILFYGDPLKEPIVVEDRLKANGADILLGQISWGELPLAQGAGRPCIRLAVFTEGEWYRYKKQALSPSELRPEMAAARYWFFPAQVDAPPMSYRVATRELVELRLQLEQALVENGVIPFPLSDLNGMTCEVPGGDRETAGGPRHDNAHRATGVAGRPSS